MPLLFRWIGINAFLNNLTCDQQNKVGTAVETLEEKRGLFISPWNTNLKDPVQPYVADIIFLPSMKPSLHEQSHCGLGAWHWPGGNQWGSPHHGPLAWSLAGLSELFPRKAAIPHA